MEQNNDKGRFEMIDNNSDKDAIILELETKIGNMKSEYETKISDMKKVAHEREFYHALEREVAGASGRNFKAVCALLDMNSLTISEDGGIEGFADQIEKLRESDSYLFYGADEPKVVIGNVGSFPRKTVSDKKKNPWSKEGFSLTEQGRILRNEPEKAKRLMVLAGEYNK
ncbi:MAG: phage scaffolding protein [Defluviitaleaceae bacterium]|nr:phage scaffolding protein [Defluviitaleaceae bacterium]